MEQTSKPKKKIRLSITPRQFLLMLAADVMYALALNCFFVDNRIAAGGLAGIATVINSFIPIPLGIAVFVMNIPIVLAALRIKGASYTNGYKPDEPYTVQMCRSANAPQDAPLTGGMVYYDYILTSGGWDTFQRAVDVILPYSQQYYKVFNCPATYYQCRVIQNGPWQGLK